MAGEERSLLGPWLDAFAKTYGRPVEVRPLVGVLEGESGAPLETLTVPAVFERPEMMGSTGHFRHMPRMMDHVRSLGFGWNEAGMITTVPTPRSLNALLDARVGVETGYRTFLQLDDRRAMSVATWLLSYLDGRIPVQVCSAAYYALQASAGARAAKSLIESVLHDLGVHALNYHLVPRERIHELTACIAAAVPERLAQCREPGATAPITLSYFFDNDFNRYCYAIWCRAERPADFAPLFQRPRNYAQLREALSLRLEETRRGLGDIASEDADEMQPLSPFVFDVP